MFEAFIAGTPKPQGSKNGYIRGNRVVLVESNKALPIWRNHAINVLRENAPVEPMAGALHVSLFFYFIRPKTSKRKHPDVKPDIDKLARALLDALTQSGVIQDDSRVIALNAYKDYSDQEGAYVMVRHAE